MKRQEFNKLVQNALDRIPAKFQTAMKNIAVVVEDRPGPEAVELAEDEDDGLYGLYLGIPLPERIGEDSGTMPDVIFLYQKPLEEDFPDRQDLIREIEITIVHELAHYFGFGEDVLEQYGYD
jgi:predicted Zn-dependent protease with MMP-like domain